MCTTLECTIKHFCLISTINIIKLKFRIVAKTDTLLSSHLKRFDSRDPRDHYEYVQVLRLRFTVWKVLFFPSYHSIGCVSSSTRASFSLVWTRNCASFSHKFCVRTFPLTLWKCVSARFKCVQADRHLAKILKKHNYFVFSLSNLSHARVAFDQTQWNSCDNTVRILPWHLNVGQRFSILATLHSAFKFNSFCLFPWLFAFSYTLRTSWFSKHREMEPSLICFSSSRSCPMKLKLGAMMERRVLT